MVRSSVSKSKPVRRRMRFDRKAGKVVSGGGASQSTLYQKVGRMSDGPFIRKIEFIFLTMPTFDMRVNGLWASKIYEIYRAEAKSLVNSCVEWGFD